MTIKEKLKQKSKSCKTERLIFITDGAFSTWFYLSDYKIKNEFLTEEILNKEIEEFKEYIRDKQKCIMIHF